MKTPGQVRPPHEATSHTTGTAVKHILSVSRRFPCPVFGLPRSARQPS